MAAVDSPAAHLTHHGDLTQADRLRAGIGDVADTPRRRLLDAAFGRFAANKQDLTGVPHGLTHGNLYDDNILVSAGAVPGVLDFGDGIHNPLVCDLAIAPACVLLDEPDAWAAAAQVVAGYHAVRRLSSTEIELLYPLICARLAVSLVTSARRRLIAPERAAWFVSEARARAFMQRHGSLDAVAVADRLVAPILARVRHGQAHRQRPPDGGAGLHARCGGQPGGQRRRVFRHRWRQARAVRHRARRARCHRVRRPARQSALNCAAALLSLCGFSTQLRTHDRARPHRCR